MFWIVYSKIEKLEAQGEVDRAQREVEKAQREEDTAKTEKLEGQIAELLESKRDQDEARFKMHHANILSEFVEKIFVELWLNYPGNLDEVKDTIKIRYAQAALSPSQRQLEVIFGG